MFRRFIRTSIALPFWLCGVCLAGEPSLDLGNLMCVGDSITHGFRSSSYRWPLHKTLVDNGVSFAAVGVHAGNAFREGSVPAGTPYAGVLFNNRHSAMSSERAYEVSGRNNASRRLGHSNIRQWLGLDPGYRGPYCIDTARELPDTFVLMIGTNDTFSDYGRRGGFGQEPHLKEVMQNLLGFRQEDGLYRGGDMERIICAMREANPACRILVLTLPSWHDSTPHSHSRADFLALRLLNAALVCWAGQHQVQVVDSNVGLVDLTREDKPGVAESAFFSSRDGLHPTPQGDLIIAESVALALGVPGRTSGLPRRDAAAFELVAGAADAAANWSIPDAGWAGLDAARGFTLALRCQVGNGAENGWRRKQGLEVSFCKPEERIRGELTISESGIIWQGGQLLYSADMSANAEEIRIAWHPGEPEAGIARGFYVWLGNRLIGEALPPDTEEDEGWLEGACAAPVDAGIPVRLESFHAAKGAYAPPASAH